MIDFGTAWAPTPKQEIFLRCPVYEVLYGGAAGGGKSDSLLVCHVEQHQAVHDEYERTGIRNLGCCLILRKEFGRLKDLMARAEMLFPVMSGGAMHWREQEHSWTCDCGYKVEFGHVEGPQDHQVYVGRQFSMLCIDQCEEIPWEQYTQIKLRVRAPVSSPLSKYLAVRLTANPMGRHSDWVKKRFNLRGVAPGFEVITENIDLGDVKIVRDRVFIPATLRDNPHLGRDYEAELMSAPEHLRRAFLDGDWDVTPGSFFGDVFDPRIHVIDDLGPTEVLIPDNWPIFRSADWGSRNPAACYWFAVDNDGLLIILDELYGPGEDPHRWAKKIYEVEERWGWIEKTPTVPMGRTFSKLQGYIDPACFKTDTSGGPTIAEKLFEEGLSWFEGDSSRKPGWTEVRRRLQERGGISGKIPGLRICRRCTNLIRTLPNLTSPENEGRGDMDDIDTKQEDHAADALRYGVMSRPMPKLITDIRDAELARWERIMLANQTTVSDGRSSATGY